MTELLAAIEVATEVHDQREGEERDIGIGMRYSNIKKNRSSRDTIGVVCIQIENKAGFKQMQEQGVHGSPNKDKFMAKSKQEQGVRGSPDKDQYMAGVRGEKDKYVTEMQYWHCQEAWRRQKGHVQRGRHPYGE